MARRRVVTTQLEIGLEFVRSGEGTSILQEDGGSTRSLYHFSTTAQRLTPSTTFTSASSLDPRRLTSTHHDRGRGRHHHSNLRRAASKLASAPLNQTWTVGICLNSSHAGPNASTPSSSPRMTPTQTLKSSELTPAHQTSPPFRNSKLELGPRCLKTSREQVVPNLDHPFHRHEIERTSCTKLPAQVAREDASQ